MNLILRGPNLCNNFSVCCQGKLERMELQWIFFPDDYWVWETPLLKKQVRKALKSRIMTVEYFLQLKGFGVLGQAKALNSLYADRLCYVKSNLSFYW